MFILLTFEEDLVSRLEGVERKVRKYNGTLEESVLAFVMSKVMPSSGSKDQKLLKSPKVYHRHDLGMLYEHDLKWC